MGKQKHQNFTTSDFYCTKCGKKGIPIARKLGHEREAGHLKKLYCLYCKQEWNHAECKMFSHYSYEDFIIEYQYKNFDNDGNRIITYGELKGRINNGKH